MSVKLNFILLKKIPKIKELRIWINWLNDFEVVKYSEQRFKEHTIKTQKSFLRKKLKEKKSLIFIILNNKEFIGVLELGSINLVHKTCGIMYFIGEKKYWYKKIGTKLVYFGANYAKKKLKLKKIITSVYKKNKGSLKVLRNNKFKIAGVLKKNFILYKNKELRDDQVILEKFL